MGSILTPEVVVNNMLAWCQAESLEPLSSRCSIKPVSEVFPVLGDLHCTVNKESWLNHVFAIAFCHPEFPLRFCLILYTHSPLTLNCCAVFVHTFRSPHVDKCLEREAQGHATASIGKCFYFAQP